MLPIPEFVVGTNVLKAIRAETRILGGGGSGTSKSSKLKDKDLPWAENYKSITTENRLRFYYKVAIVAAPDRDRLSHYRALRAGPFAVGTHRRRGHRRTVENVVGRKWLHDVIGIGSKHVASYSTHTLMQWDPKRRYQKGDRIAYNDAVYEAASNSPEGPPFDPFLRAAHDLFRDELGHPSSSNVIPCLSMGCVVLASMLLSAMLI